MKRFLGKLAAGGATVAVMTAACGDNPVQTPEQGGVPAGCRPVAAAMAKAANSLPCEVSAVRDSVGTVKVLKQEYDPANPHWQNNLVGQENAFNRVNGNNIMTEANNNWNMAGRGCEERKENIKTEQNFPRNAAQALYFYSLTGSPTRQDAIDSIMANESEDCITWRGINAVDDGVGYFYPVAPIPTVLREAGMINTNILSQNPERWLGAQHCMMVNGVNGCEFVKDDSPAGGIAHGDSTWRTREDLDRTLLPEGDINRGMGGSGVKVVERDSTVYGDWRCADPDNYNLDGTRCMRIDQNGCNTSILENPREIPPNNGRDPFDNGCPPGYSMNKIKNKEREAIRQRQMAG
jgi:hypothetical protein